MTSNKSNNPKTYIPFVNDDGTSDMTYDNRSHSFNVGIAIDYSPIVSLWICHLAFWAERNLANNKNIHDGLVWSYDTLEALGDQFPYLTKSQRETMINKSVKEGLVTVGNYNKTPYDRTCWYALTPKAYFYFPHLMIGKYIKRLFVSISEKSEMDFLEFGNQFRSFRTTIPNAIPDSENNTTTVKVPNKSKPKKLDSEPKPVSSSFFSKKDQAHMLKFKLKADKRTDEEFLKVVQEHVEQNISKGYSEKISTGGAITLLSQLYYAKEVFQLRNDKGIVKSKISKEEQAKRVAVLKEAQDKQHAEREREEVPSKKASKIPEEKRRAAAAHIGGILQSLGSGRD